MRAHLRTLALGLIVSSSCSRGGSGDPHDGDRNQLSFVLLGGTAACEMRVRVSRFESEWGPHWQRGDLGCRTCKTGRVYVAERR